MATDTRDPVRDLKEIAYLLERLREPTYRVRAFRGAAATAEKSGRQELERRAAEGTLTDLSGIGKVTAEVIEQALAGQEPDYLARLLGRQEERPPSALRQALRGDLHVHSDWSDGGSPIEEMALAARSLGHEYMALTDHSPRLTVPRGLSPERLKEQLDVVHALNERFVEEAAAGSAAAFRILTGIEVDILEDGGLDQEPELLAELDVVVASVHSKLRMPSSEMTPRMVAAIANPNMDVLGHCTGRLLSGRGRPETEFDAEIVFEACRQFGVAVEINSRPERLDPPKRLLSLAFEMGCHFTIDTDAHAPGQLEWQENGCQRAEAVGISSERVINARPLSVLTDG
jgi:putative hydrolase